MQRLSISDDTRVLVLTGAGISAESGLPTFRDANGLWENHRWETVASPEGFAADPSLVWRFYSLRRSAAAQVEPNPGHQALAELEARLGDRFLLVTQNVDGLHQRAGSERVIEIHGNLFQTRCSSCSRPAFRDPDPVDLQQLPRCDRCGALLRPAIVWFGEMLNSAHLLQVNQFLSEGGGPKLFLAVGTSGAVWPAAGLVEQARAAGASTWLVNAEPAENTSRFDHFVQGRSGEVLPSLCRPA